MNLYKPRIRPSRDLDGNPDFIASLNGYHAVGVTWVMAYRRLKAFMIERRTWPNT